VIKCLHIVALNIPFPPDFGGMIDSFYRIKSLAEAGIQIHLHCFEYGRKHSPELEKLCKSVNYYQRNTRFSSHLSLKPYTVASRNSRKLSKNLCGDDHPILFDGLHSTFWISHPALSGRRKYVRVHNIEHLYYRTLARFEMNPARKLFFSLESLKLRHYERILKNADALLTISDTDQEYFESRYNNAELITAFHPFENVISAEGTGDYIIYHGDLSVSENIFIAEYLISRIFSSLPYKCVIAGKNPPASLVKMASAFENIRIVPNPDNFQMSELIRNAHINLLFSMTSNGMKLKLLIALFSGRHCIANSNILKGTLLSRACHIEDSAGGIILKTNELMRMPFTTQMINDRKNILELYSNKFNTGRMLRLIFP
jgi:hypothetical protein